MHHQLQPKKTRYVLAVNIAAKDIMDVILTGHSTFN